MRNFFALAPVFSTATLLWALLSSIGLHAAGLTIITHGLNGNVSDWVLAMGEQIAANSYFPGTNYTCYKVSVTANNSVLTTNWTRVHGSQPTATDSGEIVVLLDWNTLADGSSYSTYDIAPPVVRAMLHTNFIPELNGHALAELPIHLIGHSRGGSLMCQISQLLGTNGLWVDQLTTLDPHPLNNDGFFDFIYRATDASCVTYENVLFHDNYYQLLDSLIHGEAVSGAFKRQLTSLNGGYSGLGGSHSDVHLWYHGTLDLNVPANDYASSITGSERQSWWTASEVGGTNAGFLYSLIGGGDRLGTNQPVSSASARIKDGYNQKWNLGAGANNNRISLANNNGTWPNLIKFNLTGTTPITLGQSNTAILYYQWAQPSFSNAAVTIYFDADRNPYNGNETPLRQIILGGTTALQVGSNNVVLVPPSPGQYAVYAEIKGNGRTRYLYAPEVLTVTPNLQPPALQLIEQTADLTQVDVFGVPGQQIVIQSTMDLISWQSIATNSLSSNRWTYVDSPGSAKFYRALLR